MVTSSPHLLVIGGRGFIGSHVVTRAAATGWQVTSLGVSHPTEEKTVAGIKSVTADISDTATLERALKERTFDYVVNCGGYIDHTSFSKGGRKIFNVHFNGVLNLVEFLDLSSLKAFVNIGSSDEYGNTPAPQVETQREAPISPYSLGKAAASHFLQTLHRTENFPAITLRLFLTYGPGQDQRRFLPQIIEGCLKGQSFPASQGDQLRDFCFIQDTVDAVFAALTNTKALGEVINIASGRPISIRSVVETVRKLIGKGDPRFGEIAYRPGENMALYADVTKARTLLNWTPQTPLEVGLEKTIESIRNLS